VVCREAVVAVVVARERAEGFEQRDVVLVQEVQAWARGDQRRDDLADRVLPLGAAIVDGRGAEVGVCAGLWSIQASRAK
jgi:hypothetical protein